MMAVHRNAAMAEEPTKKRGYPVTSITVHGWLKGYLGNPAVQWIDERTLIVWNSPEHRKLMTKGE
jgi:hypothetical protein